MKKVFLILFLVVVFLSLRLIYSTKINKSTPAAEPPTISKISGKFLTSDFYISQNPTIYLCVSSLEEFKDLYRKIVDLPKNYSEFFYAKESFLESIWRKRNGYFSVSSNWKGDDTWNILDCNYFTSSSFISNDAYIPKGVAADDIKIGEFKQTITEESVKSLVEFLHAARIIPEFPSLMGFPNYSSKTIDTPAEVSIVEVIYYSVVGDEISLKSKSVKYIFKCRVLKDSGSVLFSYSRE